MHPSKDAYRQRKALSRAGTAFCHEDASKAERDGSRAPEGREKNFYRFLRPGQEDAANCSVGAHISWATSLHMCCQPNAVTTDDKHITSVDGGVLTTV